MFLFLRMNQFKKQRLEIEVMKNWDKFYNRHGCNFFKDRHWTLTEFRQICPEINWDVRYFVIFFNKTGVTICHYTIQLNTIRTYTAENSGMVYFTYIIQFAYI